MFILFFAVAVLKNSEVYKVASHKIKLNQEIINETGGIKGFGMIPTGNVNISNGHGKANLTIKVLGNNKDLNVHTYLTKEPDGEWELIKLKK